MVMSNYNNPVLALMSTDSEDDFIHDVVEAYFNDPAHVRTILTEDCIESCLDAYMDAQTVELDLSDLPCNQDGFTKPSRKNRRKKSNRNNKKSKADRFHGSRKAYWKHQYKKWDANDRRQAMDKNGFGACHASHRIHTKGAMPMPYVPDGESETRTITYEDGFTLSMSMSKSTWEKEEEDDFSPNYNWSSQYDVPEFYWNDHYWDDKRNSNNNSEDKGLKLPAECQTWEFTPQELADFMQKLANATPEQRAMVRQFFAENL